MLNPFPIQWLALIAYFILRLFIGLALYYLASRHMKNYRALIETSKWPLLAGRALPIQLLITFELCIAILLVIGAWTQYAALMLIAMSIKMIVWHARFSHPSIPPRLVYFLFLGAGLSLFITGAGAFAVDLPI